MLLVQDPSPEDRQIGQNVEGTLASHLPPLFLHPIQSIHLDPTENTRYFLVPFAPPGR